MCDVQALQKRKESFMGEQQVIYFQKLTSSLKSFKDNSIFLACQVSFDLKGMTISAEIK